MGKLREALIRLGRTANPRFSRVVNYLCLKMPDICHHVIMYSSWRITHYFVKDWVRVEKFESARVGNRMEEPAVSAYPTPCQNQNEEIYKNQK